jgi:integrase
MVSGSAASRNSARRRSTRGCDASKKPTRDLRAGADGDGGRPRTVIGTYGTVGIRPKGRGYIATARYRDADGRLRPVMASGVSRSAAQARLKERLLNRSGYGVRELVALWLSDLDKQDLVESTKENYRDDIRRHVMPAFENLTLGEITTGRVEWFLKSEAAVSYSRAKHSRTMLNLVFGFALRYDAIPRNPVEGTSPLKKPKASPQALMLELIAAIRRAAASWRTGEDVKGPRPDGQVRDIIEVLLGTALRIGELLALRPCDIADSQKGMVIAVRGTVVLRTGHGADRQNHPKTEHSIRRIAVPEFAATVLRARLAMVGPGDAERTIFANRTGGPFSPYNVRRTFRAFLELAGLEDRGITLCWYRRTGATVIARGAGTDAAATFLGHGSTAITEGHYIEPDRTVDHGPARLQERTLRPVDPDDALLRNEMTAEEEEALVQFDSSDDDQTERDAPKRKTT